MRNLIFFGLTASALLFSSCETTSSGNGGSGAGVNQPTIQFQTSVTSRLDKNGDPVEDTNTVGRAAGRVYLVTKWFEVPPGQKEYSCELYDGMGQLVWKDKSTFVPQNGGWITRSWYSFRNVDRAGAWKFRVLLDGVPVTERAFALLDGDVSPNAGRIDF